MLLGEIYGLKINIENKLKINTKKMTVLNYIVNPKKLLENKMKFKLKTCNQNTNFMVGQNLSIKS